jgi:hypothetical protein
MAEHRRVIRPLKYAWIELSATDDARAFAAGMARHGWKSIFTALPIAKDAAGVRYVDSAHPMLPIRPRGNAILALPNTNEEVTFRPIKDPVFEAYRRENGEEAFEDENKRQHDFLSRWVFSPGVMSTLANGALTLGDGATDFADLVAASGHGGSGTVFGGGAASLNFARVLSRGGVPFQADRLKYVIIPTCYNLWHENNETWMPALQSEHPIHGLLGYRKSYPGGEIGGQIFQRFTAKLALPNKTILQAWREAHVGALADRWAAFLHESAMGDTMKDWQTGKLRTPARTGKLLWFSEDNPEGQEPKLRPKDYQVEFLMGGTAISFRDSDDPEVGLFPGERGAIRLSRTEGLFAIGTKMTVVFYYYRPDHNPGMDLDKLLQFLPTSDGQLTLVRDFNKEDIDTHVDAFAFVVLKEGMKKIEVPFEVRPKAHESYKQDGPNRYGKFWVRLVIEVPNGDPDDLYYYQETAWLRGPRS